MEDGRTRGQAFEAQRPLRAEGRRQEGGQARQRQRLQLEGTAGEKGLSYFRELDEALSIF